MDFSAKVGLFKIYLNCSNIPKCTGCSVADGGPSVSTRNGIQQECVVLKIMIVMVQLLPYIFYSCFPGGGTQCYIRAS